MCTVSSIRPPPAIDRAAILALYDVPDPQRPGSVIAGYDKAHAARTTEIVLNVARRLGVSGETLRKLEVTALLHDIGRAGMDAVLFGRIFQSAQAAGLPVRVGELVQRYPYISKEHATEAFLELARPALEAAGLVVDDSVVQHVEMRMAFDRRVRRILDQKKRDLQTLGVTVDPWMEQVILYYYYPERMEGAPEDVRLMGMVLVACENFEAYNNVQRARDYYGRDRPNLRDAFATVRRFVRDGLVTSQVYEALRDSTLKGDLDVLVRESQGLAPDAPLRQEDIDSLRELRRERDCSG